MQILMTRGGAYREITLGFSWPVFFFGVFGLIGQRNWTGMLVYFMGVLVSGLLCLAFAGSGTAFLVLWGMSVFCVGLFMSCVANEWRAQALVNRGWKVIEEDRAPANAKLAGQLFTWEKQHGNV